MLATNRLFCNHSIVRLVFYLGFMLSWTMISDSDEYVIDDELEKEEEEIPEPGLEQSPSLE